MKMNKSIKVFAPASVSNVGCGFDILGFAIDGIGDDDSVVEAWFINTTTYEFGYLD